MKKTVIYARVSTTEQSCDAQLLELRNYCALKKIAVTEEITDVISGSKSSREGLDRLMVDVRAGLVKTIIVVKLDRLARSLSHFAQLIGELNALKVSLIVPGQNIDTSESNPASRFTITILAAVAELERDLIRERTRAGLVVARAKGKVLGRVSPLMPPPAERAAVVAEWRKKTGGRDYDTLSQMLGGVSRSSAWREAKKHVAPAPAQAVPSAPSLIDLED